MLERAQARLARDAAARAVELHVMDAERTSFASDSFDAVVAMYVVSVVPHPKRLVDEMRRVCKPNGEIFIVNHFHSPNPIVGKAESLLAPLSRLVGFHPDFCLETFVHDTTLEVVDKQPVNLFGYWSLLRARNNKDAVQHLPINATA